VDQRRGWACKACGLGPCSGCNNAPTGLWHACMLPTDLLLFAAPSLMTQQHTSAQTQSHTAAPHMQLPPCKVMCGFIYSWLSLRVAQVGSTWAKVAKSVRVRGHLPTSFSPWPPSNSPPLDAAVVGSSFEIRHLVSMLAAAIAVRKVLELLVRR
jgi:hypothetical protein